MTIGLLIVILVICLLAEGFFSGSEIAVVNADKYKLALATEAGSRRALSALHLVKRPAKFFATTLLGTNLCTVTGSVVMTLFIIERFGSAYAPAALLYWPFTLILGEIVPKSFYQRHADRIILEVAPVLLAISFVLYPAVWLFSKVTEILLGRVTKRSPEETPLSREELALMLEADDSGGSDVQAAERTLIGRLFDLAEKRVRQIMTPLVDVVSVPAAASRQDAARILEEHGFSRVPVIEGRAYNIVGVLTASDLLFSDEGKGVRELMRAAYFVPEEMPLDELLVAMKRGGRPLAVAVDEYGAATGIVTVEDLLEEVIGEIRDEHDEQPQLYWRLGRYRYLLSGRLEVAQANERLRLAIPEGPYQTVAGFAIHLLEHLPAVGEQFRSGRFAYRVTRATERAVLEVEATRVEEWTEGAVDR
jgi:CBS domain containing-hemolysin-like protein